MLPRQKHAVTIYNARSKRNYDSNIIYLNSKCKKNFVDNDNSTTNLSETTTNDNHSTHRYLNSRAILLRRKSNIDNKADLKNLHNSSTRRNTSLQSKFLLFITIVVSFLVVVNIVNAQSLASMFFYT